MARGSFRRSHLLAVALVAAAAVGACGEGREREGGDDSPPEVCSSNSASHADEGPSMNPGGDCNGCHAQRGEGPIYTIVGTVMGALNDDTNCNGPAGVSVVITGADGGVLTLTTNSAGNFFSKQPVAMPFHAKVVRGGKEVAMVAAQSVGDCNTCHTAEGASNAPGRIVAP